MNSEKIILPSLRNIELRTVKTETKRINQVLPCISTNNIIELNELIYARAKSPQKVRKKNQNQNGQLDWKRR